MHFLLANAGLPMIGVQMEILIAALIPVVMIETLVLRYRLSMSFLRVLPASLIANLISTFIGIPFAWMALVFTELTFGATAWGLDTPLKRIAAVTIQAPWLIPYQNDIYWMVPTASLVLMFPFLIVSAIVESRVLIRIYPEIPRQNLQRAVYFANVISYTILIAYCGFEIDQALRSHAADSLSQAKTAVIQLFS